MKTFDLTASLVFAAVLAIHIRPIVADPPPHKANKHVTVDTIAALPRWTVRQDKDETPSLSGDDVVGKWVRREMNSSDHKVSCPPWIEHKGWARGPDRLVNVRHGQIIMNGSQCQRGGEGEKKALVFYDSRLYTLNYKPIPVQPGEQEAPQVDTTLTEIIRRSGPNNNTKVTLSRSGEAHFFGFERRPRYCSNSSKFPERTTVFIVRPVNADINMVKLGTKLDVGKRWMIIIPHHANSSCLYSPAESGRDDSIFGNESNTCFPASATVQLEDGRSITMQDLRVGDRVAIGQKRHSTVFGFTHQDRTAIASFTVLRLRNGRRLRATAGHIVYANGRVVPMSHVRVGDRMTDGNGTTSRVIKVSHEWDVGLYNPQTLHGDIVVDGALCTTYTTAVRTEAAHALLAPLRALYKAWRVNALDSLFGHWHCRRKLASHGIARLG